MALSMRGLDGQLRYGYQVVAQLSAWSLEDARVEATARNVNEVWMGESPLSLWLTVGRRAWVWREVEVASAGPPLVVRVVGSPEVRDAR